MCDKEEVYPRKANPSSSQKGCYTGTMIARVQLQKKIYGRGPQGTWRQDELLAVNRQS
jgi:hypothetical protein